MAVRDPDSLLTVTFRIGTDDYSTEVRRGQIVHEAFEGTTPELWADMVGSNLTGSFLCSKFFLPLLKKSEAGAIVHRMPSILTTVVVRGAPNPLQAAGRDAGLKLMEIKRLREKGHRITLLNEEQFWRLSGRRPR